MPLADGTAFAEFRIIRLLGSGGMGEVYLAQHPRLPRRDAVKILPADMSADAELHETELSSRHAHSPDSRQVIWNLTHTPRCFSPDMSLTYEPSAITRFRGLLRG